MADDVAAYLTVQVGDLCLFCGKEATDGAEIVVAERKLAAHTCPRFDSAGEIAWTDRQLVWLHPGHLN